jgi:hypothetical protein
MCLVRDNFLPVPYSLGIHFRDRREARGKYREKVTKSPLSRTPRTLNGWHCGCSAVGVRRFFLAWLTLALLLLGLGRFTAAGDELAIAGFVNATDPEMSEGFFPVGDDAMVVVGQGTGLQRWLNAHSGQKIRITLEADLD